MISISKLTKKDFFKFFNKEHSSILHFITTVKPWHNFSRSYAQKFYFSYANELKIDDLHPIRVRGVKALLITIKIYLKEFIGR